MFLVNRDNELLFFHKDPRHQGYGGELVENVVLYFPEDATLWRWGGAAPEPVIGVSPDNETLFQVFRSDEDRRAKGYKKVADGTPDIFVEWQDYLLRQIQKELMPEHAAEHVAINLESGEYVRGKNAREAFDAFMKRWPTKPMHKCRVDGSPSIKFHR